MNGRMAGEGRVALQAARWGSGTSTENDMLLDRQTPMKYAVFC
jgi:hypothetical protein